MAGTLATIAGIFGAAQLLIAYWLVASGRAQGDAPRVCWLNLVGSALLAVNTCYFQAYPATVLNVVWAGIALQTLRKAAFRNQVHRRHDRATSPGGDEPGSVPPP